MAARTSSRAKSERVCPRGHRYLKSSDCPVCPVCEAERKPEAGFLTRLAAPARRALEREGIASVDQLSRYSEKQILGLHGIGKTAIPILRAALEESGLAFRCD